MDSTLDIFSHFHIEGVERGFRTMMEVQYNDGIDTGRSIHSPKCMFTFEGKNIDQEFSIMQEVLMEMQNEEHPFGPPVVLVKSDLSNNNVIKAYVQTAEGSSAKSHSSNSQMMGRNLMMIVNLLELSALVGTDFRAKAEHEIARFDAYYAMKSLEKDSLNSSEEPEQIMDAVEGYAAIAERGLLADPNTLAYYGGIAKIEEDSITDQYLSPADIIAKQHIERLKNRLLERLKARLV